jgi:hypothetical protein
MWQPAYRVGGTSTTVAPIQLGWFYPERCFFFGTVFASAFR